VGPATCPDDSPTTSPCATLSTSSADGDHLALGSSTANLRMTDDQGDHWHTVANHLLPVYPVRVV
jgi:hypothetical protein